MSGAIAIFVKTPGLSPVKTRLAVKIGQKNAETFHLASAKSVASVVQVLIEDNDIKGYYAVAEQSAVNHLFWEDLPCIWQGEGGLGERMAHIYQSLLAKHDYVILVGADIPQMTVEELLIALKWLEASERGKLAFGPSEDGGFWLFGGNCNIPLKNWTDVKYSQSDTGKQFINKIKQAGEIKTLTSLRDVDEVEDLILLIDVLKRLEKPLPAQQALLLLGSGLNL